MMTAKTAKKPAAKSVPASPHLIAITDREMMMSRNGDVALANALECEGFKLGLMVEIGYTDMTPERSRAMWDAAMAHAGIRQIDTWRDERAARTMVRV